MSVVRAGAYEVDGCSHTASDRAMTRWDRVVGGSHAGPLRNVGLQPGRRRIRATRIRAMMTARTGIIEIIKIIILTVLVRVITSSTLAALWHSARY